MWHECSSTQNTRPLNSRRGINHRTSPHPKTECEACTSIQPQPIEVVTSSQYHSLDASIDLFGRVNKSDIFVGDIWITALIDTGAQVSTITQDFCKLGYIEAIVKIPPIKDYDECVPLLLLKSSSPSRVPIQLGTTVLDRAMARITVEELAHASNTWQQTYTSMMVNAKVAIMTEKKDDAILTTDAPMVTTKPILIPPFRCK